MPALTLDLSHTNTRTGVWSELFRREPVFTAVAGFMLMLMVPTGLAWLLDDRTFQGIDVWEKPLKFELAIVIYATSLAFFAKWLPDGVQTERWYRIYTLTAATGLVAEVAWIGFAASRGGGSHFNQSNIAWSIAFAIAGVTAVMFTLAAPIFGYQIWRNPRTGLSPAVKTSIVEGLVLTGVMTIVVAGYLASNGSHFVGGRHSDAGGAVIFGWARDGGDLRVPHLFATHALQAIPLFALLWSRLVGGQSVLPIRLFSLAYLSLIVFTFVQAIVGQPLLPFLLPSS